MTGVFITIASTIITLLIGMFVYTRNPKQTLNRVYALMTLAFVILMVANAFTINNYAADTLLFIRVVLFATTIAIALIYFLILYIRSTTFEKKQKVASFWIVVVTVLVAILNFTPLVFAGLSVNGVQPVPVPAIGAILFAVHFLGLLFLSFVLLFKGISTTTGAKRSQYTSILIGIAPILLVAPMTSFIMPVILMQTEYIYLSPIYILFFVSMVAYSMVKYKLFDIKLAAIRTAAYILALSTLAGVYFGLGYIVSDVFFGDKKRANVDALNIVLALLLAFIFQPVKRFFDKVTNILFYRDAYDSGEFFARLNKKLTSTTDLRPLLEVISTELSATLKAEQAFFYIESDSLHYISAGTAKHSLLPRSDAHELDQYILKNGYQVISASDLPNYPSIRRMLISHGVELILPLIQNNINIGYFCLGGHRVSKYSSRDIKVLETISDELVIAIQNALSVQEIRNLNDTLQQRINEATKELRASNAQLQRLDKAKDEFVSMASHQLRTPLTSVKGYISMVIEGDAGKISDTQKHLLEEAFTSSERMVHLINDFLNVSRLQTGKFLIDKHPIDLSRIVQQEIDGLQTTAESRNLSYVYNRPSGFPVLDIDEGKIRQVVMNFADNALYYSTEGTKIIVKLAIENGDVVFTVTDHGIGVPKDEQAQLFGKFYRASNARKQRPDGTGVGIFLAKKVVDAHGGTVIFESVENQGSTFGFRLSVAALRPADNAN